MGTKKKKPIRVVLDTNVLLSALLFKGRTARMVNLWRGGAIMALLSRETFQEFSVTLHYPKFALTAGEIKAIIEEEVLPYLEVVETTEVIEGICADPEDDKLIACAVAGAADFIVSGDRHLLAVKKFRSIRVVSVSDFLGLFS